MEILNRLMEHKNFPQLATTSLSDLMKEHPENRADARQDLQFLNAQKLGDHEAEIEKIKSVFLSILRDIKKDIDSGEQLAPMDDESAELFRQLMKKMMEQTDKETD